MWYEKGYDELSFNTDIMKDLIGDESSFEFFIL